MKIAPGWTLYRRELGAFRHAVYAFIAKKQPNTSLAKETLDKFGTIILRKKALFEKDGKTIPNSSKEESYSPDTYDTDIILWKPPTNYIRLEFENDYEANCKYIAKMERACKGLGIEYAVFDHKGKSPYFDIVITRGMPANSDNKHAKELLIDMIMPNEARIHLDTSNLGHTFSPVPGHQHWKTKYGGAVHELVRGIRPVKQKNTYPKELLVKLKESHKRSIGYRKRTDIPIWVVDFLEDYCTNNLLPVGSRHHVIEKNLSALVIHKDDQEEIIERYLEAQGRSSDTTATWMAKIIQGEYTEVSPGELYNYIKNKNIPFEIPKEVTLESLGGAEELDENIDGEEVKKEMTSPDLMKNILAEYHGEGITGETNALLALTIKATLRLVKNCKKASSNLYISDISGAGKDYIAKRVGRVLCLNEKTFFHRNSLSTKSFDYWKPDGGWNGKLVLLEEVDEELLKCTTLRTMLSGEKNTGRVVDYKYVNITIEGKPAIWLTTAHSAINDENIRRMDMLRLTIDKEHIRNVLDQGCLERDFTPNKVLRYGLKSLEAFKVVIPFQPLFIGVFSDSKVLSYALQDRLFDYIRSSAILYQWNRERDVDGNLVATLEDYVNAKYVFTLLNQNAGTILTRDEQEIMDLLPEFDEEGKTLTELANESSSSRKWIARKIQDWKRRKLIVTGEREPENGGRSALTLRKEKAGEESILPNGQELMDKCSKDSTLLPLEERKKILKTVKCPIDCTIAFSLEMASNGQLDKDSESKRKMKKQNEKSKSKPCPIAEIVQLPPSDSRKANGQPDQNYVNLSVFDRIREAIDDVKTNESYNYAGIFYLTDECGFDEDVIKKFVASGLLEVNDGKYTYKKGGKNDE